MRTGATPWAGSLQSPGRAASPLNGSADLVVVGAGISGACVAHAFARSGRRVLMLDRAGPARGSTMASTALITFELDLPLHRLARRIGTAAAVTAWRQSMDAVDRLRRVVVSERLDCEWAERDSLYLAGTSYGHRALRAEADMRKHHGIPGRFIPPAELRDRFGIDRTGGLFAKGVAVADPVLLTSSLLAACPNLEIRAPVEVRAATTNPRGVRVETDRGVLEAKTVVFCTGYALLPCLPQVGLSVDSTWAIASPARHAFPDWLARTIVWEGSDPYLYIRTTPDGRLIAGGHDEPGAARHADAGLLPRKAKRIAADVGRLLGTGPVEAKLCWSGAFGASASGLPVIGPVPGLPGCFVVAGFGGNGITHAMLAAQLLHAELNGAPLAQAGLYRPASPDRKAVAVA
jgi:glycine/D-amino acid oxidase-like deaminating enzyme